MEYPKQALTDIEIVKSDMSENQQAYQLFYYEKSGEYPDKIAVYFLIKPKSTDKEFAKRSIFFSNHCQLKCFIFDIINAYFVFREKRCQNSILPKVEMDIIFLDEILRDIKEKQINRWRKCRNQQI